MDWLQIQFEISGADFAAVEERLELLGALSIMLEDAEDQPFYEPRPGDMPLWRKISLTALFDGDTEIEWLQQTFFRNNPIEILDWRFKGLEDQAWERVWMKDFSPMQFGERLWVVPSWHQPPEPDAVNLILDPGLAFGSGTHATTALCLKWLDAHPPVGKTVLDFGCGSGILAIAALKLGATKAIGIDIDPQAIEASTNNAERNGIDLADFELSVGDQATTVKADVVMANILSGPLIELQQQLADALEPGGEIILSGILAEQVENVVQAYASNFEILNVSSQDDWQLIEARKKSA